MATTAPPRKPKAANGDGGIYTRTRSDGRVVYDVAWTYRDENGRTKRGWKRGFANRANAARHRRTVTQAVDTGAYAAPSALTLGAWLAQWIDSARLAHQTRSGYRTKIRLHITPHLGHLKLGQVTPRVLNELYRRLEREGSPGGKGPLGPNSIKHIHNIISAAYTEAGRQRMFTGMPPTRHASPPRLADIRGAAEKRIIWTGPEAKRFLAAIDGNHYAPLWRFYLATGVRRGEALGLHWDDVDFEHSRVTIRYSLGVRRLKTDEIEPGKPRRRVELGLTKSGRDRTLTIDAETMGMLRAHRAQQNTERLTLGPRWVDHDLVFARDRRSLKSGLPAGGFLHPERISAAFRREVKRVNVPAICLHEARHTWATLALEDDVPLKVVQVHLGHANIAITADIYTHVSTEMDAAAVRRVAAQFA